MKRPQIMRGNIANSQLPEFQYCGIMMMCGGIGGSTHQGYIIFLLREEGEGYSNKVPLIFCPFRARCGQGGVGSRK